MKPGVGLTDPYGSLQLEIFYDSMKKKKKKERKYGAHCLSCPVFMCPITSTSFFSGYSILSFSLPENVGTKFFQILLYSYTYLCSISEELP